MFEVERIRYLYHTIKTSMVYYQLTNACYNFVTSCVVSQNHCMEYVSGTMSLVYHNNNNAAVGADGGAGGDAF